MWNYLRRRIRKARRDLFCAAEAISTWLRISRGVKDRQNKNGMWALGDDNYLVRVTGLVGASGLFIWEICQGDGGLVLHRSAKSFPTRFEALLDSAQNAAALALQTLDKIPIPFG